MYFLGLICGWPPNPPPRIRLVHQEQEEQVAAAAAGQQPLGNAAGRGVQGGGGADV